jgi:DNA-binding winged helix-turn-helix (wHTH) protein
VGTVAEAAEPKRNWERVYEVLAAAGVGAVVSWAALGAAVGKDTSQTYERQLVRALVTRAVRQLEQDHQLIVQSVRGKGYKIVPNTERLAVARRHQDRAARHVKLAHQQVSDVDLSSMTPETRRLFEATAMALSHQAQVINQTNIRQGRLEAVVDGVLQKQTVHDQHVDELRERMEKLESRLGAAGIAPTYAMPPGPYAPPGVMPGAPAHWQYAPGYPHGQVPQNP